MPKAKRGGGPKTQAGKLAASGNALKTGIYASALVLPDEEAADFQKLEGQFFEDFDPQDMAERLLVHDLAVITWKKLRLDRVSNAVMTSAFNKPLTWLDLSNEKVAIDDEYLPLLSDLSLFTPAFIEENLKQLEFLDRFEDYPIGKEEFWDLPKTFPNLFQVIVDQARDQFKFTEPNPSAEQIMLLNFKDERHLNHNFVHYIFPIIRQQCERIAYIVERIDELRAAAKRIKERRLLEMMQQPTIARATEDLGRAFSRTLNELRRQQTWRSQIKSIDVTPTKRSKS